MILPPLPSVLGQCPWAPRGLPHPRICAAMGSPLTFIKSAVAAQRSGPGFQGDLIADARDMEESRSAPEDEGDEP